MKNFNQHFLFISLIWILLSKQIFPNELNIILGDVKTDNFPEICFSISVKDSGKVGIIV